MWLVWMLIPLWILVVVDMWATWPRPNRRHWASRHTAEQIEAAAHLTDFSGVPAAFFAPRSARRHASPNDA